MLMFLALIVQRNAAPKGSIPHPPDRMSVSCLLARIQPPAGSFSVTRRRLIDTAFLRRRGFVRSVSVPVAVSVQIVSQPTRSGSTRVAKRLRVRSGLTVTCGPSGSGSVGSFGGGGLAIGPRVEQAGTAGA